MTCNQKTKKAGGSEHDDWYLKQQQPALDGCGVLRKLNDKREHPAVGIGDALAGEGPESVKPFLAERDNRELLNFARDSLCFEEPNIIRAEEIRTHGIFLF